MDKAVTLVGFIIVFLIIAVWAGGVEVSPHMYNAALFVVGLGIMAAGYMKKDVPATFYTPASQG